MSSTSAESVKIQAKLTQSFRLYVILAGFMVGMFGVVITLATSKSDSSIVLLVAALVLLLAAFFVALVRYATDKVELQLTTRGILETKVSSGQTRELDFDDFKQFGFMSDGRGNYWVRIRLKSGGPLIKYSPMGIRAKFRGPFMEFGHLLRRSVDAFNAQKSSGTATSMQSAPREMFSTPSAQPIQTGLIKSEKALNWTMLITRIIYLGIILISGITYIATSDHPGQTLLYILIAGIVLFGIYWFVKKNKAKK